ncbi:jerky protein homolog-like [Colletes gigas]|uniref:jerky protein homolog-like n=1 Tax=Colletes gigas TaxID=935657 RepID=UPI001C9BAEB3|nr:jerky protein homolog-like [Colletes gigas]
MTSIPTKKGRTTIATRLEILQKFEKGVSVQQLIAEYGVSKRTIFRYRNSAASIRNFMEKPNYMDLKKKIHILHEDIDNRLYAWITEKQDLGEILTDSLLQKKARELHAEFDGTSKFTASRGWLRCFKRRHDVHLSGIHLQKPNKYDLAAEKFIEELSTLLEEENIHKENIYNMDETSLMWKALSRKTLSKEREQGKKRIKVRPNRISLIFCTNATGSHKFPLLLINKSAHPRSIKDCLLTLPVVYKTQTNGWIDETIFNDWFTNHFKPSVLHHQRQNHRKGKVLLLIGNSKEHIPIQQIWDDSQFKVIFLPPNTSSIIQPLDQGIIEECKKMYQHDLHHRVLQYDELKQFYINYGIKDCIDIISEAWNRIMVIDIKNSWTKLLGQTPLAEDPNDHDPMANIQSNAVYFIDRKEYLYWKNGDKIYYCKKHDILTNNIKQ